MKAIFAASMLSVVGMIVAELITLIYGVGLVTPYILDTGYSHDMFVVLPFFVTIAIIAGYPLLTYYFLIVAAIVASCTWILLTNYKRYSKELLMTAKSREHSAIFDLSGLLFVSFFLTLVIVFLASLLGAKDTGGSSVGDIQDSLFQLANASVWEEIVVRVFLIGMPLLVIDLFRRKTKRWYSYIVGGKFEFGIPEVVLLITSATIFGYAHYLGGWDAWKIPAASIQGLAFGYLFLRHGLAAGIVMHFVTDYTSLPSEVFGFSKVFESLLVLAWLGLGLVFTVYYLIRIGEFLTGKKYIEATPQPAGAPWPQPWTYQAMPPIAMPPYPQPQGLQSPPDQRPLVTPQQAHYGGYVCPNCGYTEARWINGQFQCLRCGRLT